MPRVVKNSTAFYKLYVFYSLLKESQQYYSGMANKINYFILTGDPGVGKTTLIKKLCLLMNEKGVKTVGFFTEEIRRNRVREGFDVVSLNGERGRLAREQSLLPTPATFTVGKYGVLVQEFENIAMQSMKMPENTDTCVLVIDEIGKMEFFSTNFKLRIKEVFGTDSKNIVLATLPVRKSDPLIESIRNNSKSKVWTVTRENRNSIHKEIEKEMYAAIKII